MTKSVDETIDTIKNGFKLTNNKNKLSCMDPNRKFVCISDKYNILLHDILDNLGDDWMFL